MRSHYTYNPFDEEILSSLLFLRSSRDLFLVLAKILIEMKRTANDVTNRLQMFITIEPIDTTYFERLNKQAAHIFLELRHHANTYYECWILNHMIRIMYLIVFGYDIAHYVFALRNNRELKTPMQIKQSQ